MALKVSIHEHVCNPKEGEPLVECRCTIFININKKENRLRLKIDTIKNHMGKVYKNKSIDVVEKSVKRWKTKEECQHVKNVEILEI